MVDRRHIVFSAAILLGSVLAIVGVVASVVTGFGHWTSMIPVLLGVAVIGLGVMGQRERRERAAAYLVGAAGLLAALGSTRALAAAIALLAGREVESATAAAAQAVTFVVGLLLVAAFVKYLLDERSNA